MTQFELNRMLSAASTTPNADLDMIEKLLNTGADPLGPFENEDDYDDCVLDELFCDAQSSGNEQLPVIVGLFLSHGMDVTSVEFDVLHTFTWVRNESGLQTLKVFLDHGLSASSVDSFFRDMIGDILQFEIDPRGIENVETCAYNGFPPQYHDRLVYAIRMLLLASSYEYVLNESTYIKTVLNADDIGFNFFSRFRNCSGIRCGFDLRDPDNPIVTVFDSDDSLFKFELLAPIDV